jgi:hypothetical protein
MVGVVVPALRITALVSCPPVVVQGIVGLKSDPFSTSQIAIGFNCSGPAIFSLGMAVVLVLGGTLVELVIVPFGLVVFGTVSAIFCSIIKKAGRQSDLRRVVVGLALATESGVDFLVAAAIAIAK